MAKKLALALLLALAIVHAVVARSTRVARAPVVVEQKTKPENTPCEYDSPCGWAIYLRPSRDVDSYVYNCKCKSDELCTKYEDDISIKAFVYKCRPDDTLFNSTSTVAPPTTIMPQVPQE